MKRLLALGLAFMLLLCAAPTAFAVVIEEPPDYETESIVWSLEGLQNAILMADDGDVIYLLGSIAFAEGEYCIGADDKTLTLMFDSTQTWGVLFYTTEATEKVKFQNLVLSGENISCSAVIQASYREQIVELENISIQNFSCSAAPVVNRASMIINGCELSGNSGNNGGHIYNQQGTLEIIGSVLDNGKSGAYGGAIYNLDALQVRQTQFQSNSAKYGGAIYSAGECGISDCTIIGNKATGDGGAICNGSNGNLELTDCEIYGNTADFASDDIRNEKTMAIQYTKDFSEIYMSSERIPYGWVSDSVAFRLGAEKRIDYNLPIITDATKDGFLMIRFAFEDEIPVDDADNGEAEQPTEPDDNTGSTPSTGGSETEQPPDQNGTGNDDAELPTEPEQNTGGNTPPPTETDSNDDVKIPRPPEADDEEDTVQPAEPPIKPDRDEDSDRPPRPSRPSEQPVVAPEEPITEELVLSYNGATLDISEPVVLAGYGDGLLHEEDPLTRAQIAQIIFRLLTEESKNTHYSTENSFSDVPHSAWYNEAVSTIASAELVVGYGGSFHPEDDLTWAQLLTILARFVDRQHDVELIYIDMADHWALESIKTAVYYGWIEDNSGFEPDKTIARGEAVGVINQVIGH